MTLGNAEDVVAATMTARVLRPELSGENDTADIGKLVDRLDPARPVEAQALDVLVIVVLEVLFYELHRLRFRELLNSAELQVFLAEEVELACACDACVAERNLTVRDDTDAFLGKGSEACRACESFLVVLADFRDGNVEAVLRFDKLLVERVRCAVAFAH